MKIAYIGIDLLYPALPALAAAGCEILEIFTCETDNETEFNLQIQSYAHSHHIPLTIGVIGGADFLRLKAQGCDAVICGGYYHRISIPDDLPIVNIHPSLLPEGRGAWPMPVAILNGHTATGITLHKMDAELDCGDILLQRSVSITPQDNLHTLTGKLQQLLPSMMTGLVQQFHALWESATPQNEGSYWPCPDETAFPITLKTTTQQADLILRAFYGYACIYIGSEGTFALIGGEVSPHGTFPLADGAIRAQQALPLATTL